ncbi:hypothetical protein LRAMOSA10307 [Lichtheimia ramosa]|uniref:Cyclin-D1-binding protein 1-like N-terminal domain-containing protein n=1 Tax=Lichtheimia ramosa TaxID=688394 RepID=A0A077WQH8_9FUNG|nr:hypothetical protein LRAMOSA10307 [Lichtheimia ramosa]
MATEQEFQQKLKACCSMAETYLEDIKIDRPVTDDTFDTADLQSRMSKLAKVLSHDATKFTIACKPPRKPADAIRMVDEMSNTFFRMMGFYNTIPASAGQQYRTTYRKAIRDLLMGALSLWHTFREDDDGKFMVPTAALWETCKMMETSLPANNQAAVLAQWKDMHATMEDAKQEVHDLAEGEDEDIEPEMKPVAAQCAKLVDLAVFVSTKIERRCLRETKDVKICDQLYIKSSALADETDVVVSQLYDVDDPELMRTKHIAAYIDCLCDLMAFAQKHTTEEHAKWFEMGIKKVREIAEKKQ